MARKNLERKSTSPFSHVQDRASDVVFNDKEEFSSQRVAGFARAVSGSFESSLDLETALDRLLTLSCELPVAQGPEAVTQALVNGVSNVMPACSIAACLVEQGQSRQFVVRVGPEGDSAVSALDPARLFPGAAAELVMEVDYERFAGSTFHVAADDAVLLADDGPASFVARRALRVLVRALEHADAKSAATRARHSIHSLNAQIVQAEKLASLGQIAAGMVHELNNPLTSIVAYSDYLTKRWMSREGNADELERLRRIGESAHRLLRFTRDLVTYARPASEVPMPTVVHGVIDQALVFCEHLLAETGTRVERRFGDGILPVRGLPEQLTQVFVNLITNACHAMPEGGTLTVTTELTDGESSVRIVVADTGHGIPSDRQRDIFTPFFTTKTDGRGTGLGLAIVKSIVDSHQGDIDVESEQGGGARFILRLPVASR